MASRRPEQVFAAAVVVYGLLSPVLAFPHQGFAIGKSVGAFVLLYLTAALFLIAPLLLLLLWGWLFRNRFMLATSALIAVELAVMNPILIRRDLTTGHGAWAFIALPLQETMLALMLGLLFAAFTLARWLRGRRRRPARKA
jgi:hypothetical protein